ncbi:MAG TPA: transglycosylase SLT domain-containing protein [Trueperaceae bacterium]|nr:transglycosylase SLT domain-containing protein [Trueperaceae bacterium]
MRVKPKAHARTATVAASLALGSAGLYFGVAYLTQPLYDTNDLAWRYTYAAPRLDQADHVALPVRSARGEDPLLAHVGAVTRPAAAAPLGRQTPQPAQPAGSSSDSGSRGLSPFCRPELVAGAATSERVLVSKGETTGATHPTQHSPLSPWGLLVLARLVPLLSHLEEAATAYDIDAGFLLQVLLNESYLDPLAVGPTGDLGLAQLTSDALTLLRSVSAEEGSALWNEQLFAGDFSVYDPEFSLCAGAAKLAWASSQPFGDDEEVAYALYINPLHGATGGRVADTHLEPVAAMVELQPLVELLASTVVAYRADPATVSADERALLDIATTVAAGELDVQAAYTAAAQLVAALAIDDREFYRVIAQRLYDTELAGVAVTWPPGTTSQALP